MLGRLGKGGMGEVYRADDLKLGQPVALKFLPADVDRDPARLTQLHTEVRMARQVAHPNVCRVYDIDETDGHTFLSMEYVDGEDLGSLLKRIGRFPQDRAIEVARQICSGLAAAHERGVIHRDFKPANVMLDSAGKVRITDFGLAGTSGEVLRAGTPAYMAPEQISGAEVTARSDIYALGLVLYEVFTGQRALEGKNLAELIHKREQLDFPQPSAIVRDLDPEIERAIMRCLQPDPAVRPSSALSVAAALPGGDPLAAALAAGQTPSPEMVAAAGTSDALSFGMTALASLWIALSLVALLVLYQRVMLINRVPMPKPPEALLDRAQEALSRLGYERRLRRCLGRWDVARLRELHPQWIGRAGPLEGAARGPAGILFPVVSHESTGPRSTWAREQRIGHQSAANGGGHDGRRCRRVGTARRVSRRSAAARARQGEERAGLGDALLGCPAADGNVHAREARDRAGCLR